MNVYLALFIIFLTFAIGSMVSVKTKGMVSMLMVAMVAFFIGFRTNLLPATIFQDSGLSGMASFATVLLLVHIGTTTKLRDFLREWRTVLLALISTLVITLGVAFIGSLLFDRQYALAGAPIVAGGIVSCLVMQEAVNAIGRPEIAIFCSIIIVIQAVVGIPLASILAKKAALNVRDRFRDGHRELAPADNGKVVKRLIPPIPQKYDSEWLILAKMALVSVAASYIGSLTGVSALIWGLLLGITLKELGFLEEGGLVKAGGFSWMMAATLTVVFSSLPSLDMATLKELALPLVLSMVIGVVCCCIASVIMGKLLKFDMSLAIAMGLSALYGFPSSYLIAEEVSKAAGETDEEREYVMNYISPKLIIAGFVQMSIVSGIVAGFLVPLL